MYIKICSASDRLKNRFLKKITDPDRDQARPSIQPVSADLKAGRVTADGAPVGTEFQSQIADGK